MILKLPNKIKHTWLPVKVFPKSTTDEIQRHRIGTRVDVAQTKSEYPQVVPEVIVEFLSSWIKVEKQHKCVKRRETYRKHCYEDQYCHCYFFSSFYLKREIKIYINIFEVNNYSLI